MAVFMPLWAMNTATCSRSRIWRDREALDAHLLADGHEQIGTHMHLLIERLPA
jgi:hypothetical protein